jgi:2-acylglycerol O-acyltransferase 2
MILLQAGYPLAFGMIVLGFCIGIALTSALVGFFTVVVISLLMYAGVIRICPILDGVSKLLHWYDPETPLKVEKNIRENITVEGKVPEGKHIYIFHPHGLFSISQFFHIATTLTKWPNRNIKGTVISWFRLLPFGPELLEMINCVPSEYEDMRAVLKGGSSLSVALGGVREILYTEPGKLRLSIARKEGIFKMAIETGTPLIPCLTYGENEMFEFSKIYGLEAMNNILSKWGICIPLPTLESWKRWRNFLLHGSERPIRTVIGPAVDVGSARIASAREIVDLREKYFVALRELYFKTRPEWYAGTLEII